MSSEFQPLDLILKDTASKIDTASKEDLAELLTVFQAVRKGCADNKEFQNEAGCALSTMSTILTWLKCNEMDDLLNVGLQAVGNMIVQNADNQAKVWNIMSGFVRNLVNHPNNKIGHVSSMILYNVLLGVGENLTPDDSVQILKDFLPFRNEASEFSIFSVELLVSLRVTENAYDQLCKDGRLHLLDTIYSMILNEDGTATPRSVPLSSMVFLVEQFKKRNFYLLKTSDKYIDLLEPCEVSKLLDIVSAASSREPYLEHFQKDRSLLIDCTYVLKSVHMAGKAGNPEHTPLTQLSDFSSQMEPNYSTLGAGEKVTESPTFNFKSSLIRLLGNLCWKNKINQDEVREMDGIPLLLDCCHIDARNPLLIQWVVLAIRNLCEKNLENQAVIANMNREGVVESRLLHELGLTLNEDEDGKTVRVVPLKKK